LFGYGDSEESRPSGVLDHSFDALGSSDIQFLIFSASLNVVIPTLRSEKEFIMILGMTTATFTLVHVLLSLAGIASGFIVVYGLLTGKRLDGWTAIFLVTTVLTSLTGYLFPVEHILPSHVVGAISLAVLAVAIVARYAFHLSHAWRWIYVVCAVLALYLNSFVAVVQSFLKVSALKALAPTQKEPPFLVAQLAVMAVFIVIGIFAVKKFQLDRAAAASPSNKDYKSDTAA
jgi:hypothetical protein